MLNKLFNGIQPVHDGAGLATKGWAAWDLPLGKGGKQAFLAPQRAFNYSQKDRSLILNFISFDSEVARCQTNRERGWKDKTGLWRGRHKRGIRMPGPYLGLRGLEQDTSPPGLRLFSCTLRMEVRLCLEDLGMVQASQKG